MSDWTTVSETERTFCAVGLAEEIECKREEEQKSAFSEKGDDTRSSPFVG